MRIQIQIQLQIQCRYNAGTNAGTNCFISCELLYQFFYSSPLQLQQNQRTMNSDDNENFIYEEKNENFPQYKVQQYESNSNIGKILAKYRNKKIQYSDNLTNQDHQPSRPVAPISTVNYSQIYNDLKIQKSVEEASVSNSQSLKKVQKLQRRQEMQELHHKDSRIFKNPYTFHSAMDLRNKPGANIKKPLPGMILHSSKNMDSSFYSNYPENRSDSGQQSKKVKPFKSFRLMDFKQGRRKQGSSQYQFSEMSFNAPKEADFPVEEPKKMRTTDRLVKLNKIKEKYGNVQTVYISPSQQKKDSIISEQQRLGNSRSIGVGNHRINKSDLYQIDELKDKEVEINNSPNLSPSNKKNSSRYQILLDEEKLENEYERERERERQHRKQKQQSNRQKKEQRRTNLNPQIREKGSNEQNEDEKKVLKNRQRERGQEEKRRNLENQRKQEKQDKNAHRRIHSFQALENIHIVNEKQDNRDRQSQGIGQQKIQQNLDYKRSKQRQTNQERQHLQDYDQENIVHFQKQEVAPFSVQLKDNHSKKGENSRNVEVEVGPVSKFLNKGQDPLSLQVSRIASTIKHKNGEEDNHKNEHDQEELNIPFDHLADEISDNVLDLDIRTSQNQPKQESPQQKMKEKIEKSEYIVLFDVKQYSRIYEVLKSIQNSLRSPVLNGQEVLKQIKSYLEIIATGNLDNIDEFDLPLHKKKIIKNSLFLERVSIIVLAFTYTKQVLKQSLKYLQNIMGYGINNCLILVKVLEQTQIVANKAQKYQVNKSSHINQVLQKSDRLVMKRNLDTLRNNNNVLFDAIQKLSKGEQLFYQNLSQIVKLISKSSLQHTFYNLLEYFSFYLCVSENDQMIPFLAVAPNPYLPPALQNSKYTLVIDIIQIFCYSKKPSKTSSFRPFTQHFLQQMSQYYEIISFCPMFPNQIDKVIDMLDPRGLISHRLYKHHTIKSHNNSLKFLDRIGRQVDQMILLDNESVGGQGSLENCIHIPMWKGNKNDTVLAQLCPLLAMIALKRVNSRNAVSKIREQLSKNKKEGVKYINFGMHLD